MGKIIDFPGEDKKSPQFIYSNYWIPTKESGEKTNSIKIESSLNQPFEELGDRTPFEDAIIHKNANGLLRLFPYLKKTPLFQEYRRRLPLNGDEFIYKSVYMVIKLTLSIRRLRQ